MNPFNTDIQSLIDCADHLFFRETGRHLNDQQKTILEGVLQRKMYPEIAQENQLSEIFVKYNARVLWIVLSQALGRKVRGKNLRLVLEEVSPSVQLYISLGMFYNR